MKTPWLPLTTKITVFPVSIATKKWLENFLKISIPLERLQNSNEFSYIILFLTQILSKVMTVLNSTMTSSDPFLSKPQNAVTSMFLLEIF